MAGTTFHSFEPATGERLWSGDEDVLDPIVARARAAWPTWATRPLAERIAIMRDFANRAKAETEPLAALIARETGKPLWEARTEVEAVAGKVDIAVRAYADRSSQRRIPAKPGTQGALRHKPHGVLGVLGPYNFPAHLPNGHIVPALIAGNAIIFKPSEKTPVVGAALVDLYRRAGVPEGVVQVCQGGGDTGRALVAHRDVDGILFTGSARAGIAINRALAAQPGKIVALEMGGNNPLIAWDAADLQAAAVLIVQSAFLTAGQRCTAARRLIVRDTLAPTLIAEVRRLADRLIIDEPFAERQPFMGPVIDAETADGLTESFVALISHGGVPIKHMVRLHPERPFITPGIIDVTSVRDRPDIELFGPLLQVIRVTDFDEAIAVANDTRFGLAAALVGGTADLYDRFWANSRAGIVNWNATTNGASSEAPFGGIGLSGNHRPSAYYAADYCAYPVVSMETDAPRGLIGIGLKDETLDEDTDAAD